MTDMATLDEVKDFANAVRAAGGGNPIDALIPAVPQDPSACLIAVNLNFNCEVITNDSGAWSMYVTDPDVRDRIAHNLDLDAFDDPKRRGPEYGVVLPRSIAAVAEAFDDAQDALDAFVEAAYDAAEARELAPFEEPTLKDIRAAWETLAEDSRDLLRKFSPYISAAREEAFELASIINPDGSIVL